jgi:hypothetical protein
VIEVERDSVETIRLPEVELDFDMTALPVQIGLKYGTLTTWTSATWSAILNNGDGTWTAVATSAEITFSAANYPQRRYAVLTRVNNKNIERAGSLRIV